MSSCILQDAFGGMMINVDMLATNSHTLDNPAFTGLKLKVTPNDYTTPSENTPPEANFSWSADNLTVTFTNTSTDADGDDLTFGWDFGDGDTSADMQALKRKALI